MKLEMRRIILFTSKMQAMADFYQNVIGLPLLTGEEGWREYQAGGCNIALHRGKPSVGMRPPKMVFFAADVAAARATLVRRGARTLGKVISGPAFDMCNGKDPDGNSFQISSRR